MSLLFDTFSLSAIFTCKSVNHVDTEESKLAALAKCGYEMAMSFSRCMALSEWMQQKGGVVKPPRFSTHYSANLYPVLPIIDSQAQPSLLKTAIFIQKVLNLLRKIH
jgi:hypothetical protein